VLQQTENRHNNTRICIVPGREALPCFHVPQAMIFFSISSIKVLGFSMFSTMECSLKEHMSESQERPNVDLKVSVETLTTQHKPGEKRKRLKS
jgi:hypothetical protein